MLLVAFSGIGIWVRVTLARGSLYKWDVTFITISSNKTTNQPL